MICFDFFILVGYIYLMTTK